MIGGFQSFLPGPPPFTVPINLSPERMMEILCKREQLGWNTADLSFERKRIMLQETPLEYSGA